MFACQVWTSVLACESACSIVNFESVCLLVNFEPVRSFVDWHVFKDFRSKNWTDYYNTSSYSTKNCLERQRCVIKTTRQYCLITAFNTFSIIWLIAITSRQLNAGFFSLADIAFQGSFSVKYSVVIIIIVIIIFHHHHVRESSSCADERTFPTPGCQKFLRHCNSCVYTDS